jgi:hypothetical protein
VTEDLHPYDGKERRFRFDDDTRAAGLALVAKLLKLPAVPSGARFELRFFSGGIGIFDNLAIAIAATRDDAQRIADACGFTSTLDEYIDAEHVMYHRQAFQPDCAADDPIWCEPGSDVNHWTVIWFANGELAYLGYDQG